MKELLRSKITWKAQVLPLTVTYNHTLPNIKQVIQNHWPISKVNKAPLKKKIIWTNYCFSKK